MSQTSIETLENLDCVKNLDSIKKSFVLKLDNRKRLQNYLSVCTQLGFDKFCETCSPSAINREVIKELISKKSKLNYGQGSDNEFDQEQRGFQPK